MRKNEFINELKSRLRGYPKDVVQNAVNYYSECIDDAVEDGRSESEAVRALGDMDEIVRNTLKDVPLTKLVKERVKTNHKLSGFEILILILGFPLWFPLLIVWSVILAFAITAIALLIGGLGVALTSAGAFMTGAVGAGVFTIGGGLACFGASLILLGFVPLLAKGGISIGKWFLLGVKRLFVRNGGND